MPCFGLVEVLKPTDYGSVVPIVSSVEKGHFWHQQFGEKIDALAKCGMTGKQDDLAAVVLG